ncbi:hypothetical protein [Streptomyces globisporus]
MYPFEAMYPGDAAVDWMGVSVFAHELCLPVYDRGYPYNGTPPQNYDVAASQCRNAYVGSDAHGNPADIWRDFDHDANVLKPVTFAKDHGKPVVVAETGMMNFSADGREQERGALWVGRLFSLMNYRGPITNLSGEHDFRGVIRSVVYINLDFRYGCGTASTTEASTSHRTPPGSWAGCPGTARESFCRGLAAGGFGARCR